MRRSQDDRHVGDVTQVRHVQFRPLEGDPETAFGWPQPVAVPADVAAGPSRPKPPDRERRAHRQLVAPGVYPHVEHLVVGARMRVLAVGASAVEEYVPGNLTGAVVV